MSLHTICVEPVGGMHPEERPPARAEEHARLVELLDERLRFKTLLARLSATFIHLPTEAVDGQIQFWLQQIVEFLQIERSSLAQFSEDGGKLVTTHSYSAPAIPPFPPLNLAVAMPWYAAQILQGEVLRFTRLPEELPAEATAEREYCRQSGLQSQLTIPFLVGEKIVGGIGFGAFHREFDWPDDLVQSLQLVGEVFANALERKAAEERETLLRDQLAQAARVMMMGELAASIAHEVNQPLCAILSNAQALLRMLAGGFDLAEIREALQDISQDAQRASVVVARTRSFVHQSPAERTPVDVNDLIREVSGLARGEMARRRVVVKLELAGTLPAILGDAVQLQQVILNLLGNGADSMDGVAWEARELVMRSSADGAGAVTVAVADAGVGLGTGEYDQLFNAFFTTKPGGMGMGLAISKSIIQAHGGRIWASQNEGGGATFQFTLPGFQEGGT